jgi:hypothetical protein
VDVDNNMLRRDGDGQKKKKQRYFGGLTEVIAGSRPQKNVGYFLKELFGG